MAGITIRNMSLSDLSKVHAIGKHCFTTPWKLRSFEYELANKDAIMNVALVNKEIIGYVCLRSILDVTHVMDLAVEPRFRRLGAGSMLLLHALRELRRLRSDIHMITLEVRESNIAAVKLYEKFGFSEIGRRRGYYQNPHEDAIIMELDLNKENANFTFH